MVSDCANRCRRTPLPPGFGAGFTAYDGVTSDLTSRLQTVGTTFATPNPRVGNWGEAMISMQAISATGVYSVIHDIEYQLKVTGATLR